MQSSAFSCHTAGTTRVKLRATDKQLHGNAQSYHIYSQMQSGGDDTCHSGPCAMTATTRDQSSFFIWFALSTTCVRVRYMCCRPSVCLSVDRSVCPSVHMAAQIHRTILQLLQNCVQMPHVCSFVEWFSANIFTCTYFYLCVCVHVCAYVTHIEHF
jgi:hypothetical protein